MRVRPTLLVLATLLLGCESAEPEPPDFSVRDSAGVRIFTHVPVPGPELTLSPSPMHIIGGEPNDSLALFRVAGGMLLPADEFVVADAGNYRLLHFSAEGALLQTLGGRGDGPGEFQSIQWLQVSGEGFATYDSRARRVTWFGPRGAFLASLRFSPERPQLPSDDAIFTGGHVLSVVDRARVVGYAAAFADPKGSPGPLPVVADVAVFDSTSAETTEAGRFTVIEWREDPAAEGFPIANWLEAGRIYWHGRGNRLAIADATAHRVDLLVDGAPSAVIVENRQRVHFDPDSIPSGYDGAVDSLQAYRDVRIDAEGRLWVQPAVPEGVVTTGWRVFRAYGQRIGTLDLPSDAVVLDASATRILLLRRDEFDAESIEVWDLLGPRR